MSNKVFVGNLSWNSTDETLAEFFSGAGEVVEAKIITDRYTGRSRGFGFVTYTDDESAKKAVDMFNGKEYDGRELNVNEAKERT